MYVWESEKSPKELIASLSSPDTGSHSFRIKGDKNFVVESSQATHIFGLPLSLPRVLAGTITEKGTGSEITAVLKTPAFFKYGYIFNIAFFFVFGIVFTIQAPWFGWLFFLISLYWWLIYKYSPGEEASLLEFVSDGAGAQYRQAGKVSGE